MNVIKRQELKELLKEKTCNNITNCYGVYILPNRRKHESGYMCMDFIAQAMPDRHIKLIGFGGICDDIELEGSHFRIECEYPSGIIHIWNTHKFTVYYPTYSTVCLTEE